MPGLPYCKWTVSYQCLCCVSESLRSCLLLSPHHFQPPAVDTAPFVCVSSRFCSLSLKQVGSNICLFLLPASFHLAQVHLCCSQWQVFFLPVWSNNIPFYWHTSVYLFTDSVYGCVHVPIHVSVCAHVCQPEIDLPILSPCFLEAVSHWT